MGPHLAGNARHRGAGNVLHKGPLVHRQALHQLLGSLPAACVPALLLVWQRPAFAWLARCAWCGAVGCSGATHSSTGSTQHKLPGVYAILWSILSLLQEGFHSGQVIFHQSSWVGCFIDPTSNHEPKLKDAAHRGMKSHGLQSACARAST